MNYYKRHLGDFTKDTAHLSPLEVGVYDLLLDRYYATEKPIAEGDAMRVCRAGSSTERRAVTVVLREFFKLRDGHWHHDYADSVIDEAHKKAGTSRVNGKLGGRPKRTQEEPKPNPEETQTVISGNPEETLAVSRKPLAVSQEPEKRERARADQAQLTEDWQPPAGAEVRLRMAGHSGQWLPENVGTFVAHHRAKQTWRTEGGWLDEWVKWMLRERTFARSGAKTSAEEIRDNAAAAAKLIRGAA